MNKMSEKREEREREREGKDQAGKNEMWKVGT